MFSCIHRKKYLSFYKCKRDFNRCTGYDYFYCVLLVPIIAIVLLFILGMFLV